MEKIIFNILSKGILEKHKVADVKIKEAGSGGFPYEIEMVAENLDIPWAIAISEDGRLFFTERPGVVSIIENGILRTQPIITFGAPFVSIGEGGLMGIALDPDFLENQSMYVMQSYTEGDRIDNRVVRLLIQDYRATVDKVLLDKIPGGQIHNGGRIKIGPDQKLYITTGDAGQSMLAQDITSLAGKILRINQDGSIPEDNPFPGSPVYSYGYRNPEGLAWNSDNVLYASEHGQTAHDEINIIQPGANYGWPLVQGDEDAGDATIRKPLIHSGEDTWAPSGIAFVNQGPWQGKLLVANLRGEQLLAMTLDREGTSVEKVEAWLRNEFGRLREVVQAEDGSIYLATSNMDGRGNPDMTDDKIIRLIPL